jgi:hypothetical protein
VNIEEAIQNIAEQRKLFPQGAGPDENLGGYLLGLEDALRILRGQAPKWEAGPFDAHASKADPWMGDSSG